MSTEDDLLRSAVPTCTLDWTTIAAIRFLCAEFDKLKARCEHLEARLAAQSDDGK
jgi:hypothetical protein